MTIITTVQDATRNARKEYGCQLCGRRIAKGERYHYQFNTRGPGEAWSWRECAQCAAVIETLFALRYGDFFDDGIDGYSLFDTLRESGRPDLLRLAVGMKRQWRNWSGGMLAVPTVPTRRCIDCSEPVDGPRSYTWCERHDAERIARVSRQLADLAQAFGA